MPVTLEQISPKPILVMRYSGRFISGQMLPIFVEIAKVADQIQPVYVIVDLLDLTMDFSEIMLSLAEGVLGGPGTGGDPRVKPVFAGNLEMVQFMSDTLKQKQYGQIDIPAFSTFDAALAYINGL